MRWCAIGADSNGLGAGELEDGVLAEFGVGVEVTSDAERVEGSDAGAEGLLERVKAAQNISGFSVIGFGGRGSGALGGF